MKKYQAYKDSGISWIGEIPVDWSIKKLKDYTTINDEVLTESTAPNYEFRYVDIGSVTLQKGIEQRCLPIRKHRGAREKRYSFGYAVFLILALMK